MKLFVIALVMQAANAYGQECFSTSVMTPSPLIGNHGEIFRTADGSVYEVVGSYEYLYAYNPTVTICPARSKMLVGGKTVGISPMKAVRKPSSSNGRSAKTADPRTSPSPIAPITVALRVRRCAYFLADGPRGLYLLEWYGGHDPERGEGIYGELAGYGFKDVLYSGGREGRVYVDDYMLSKDRALEKLDEKCK